MGIMEAFANQLGGPLEITDDGGTLLTVQFGAHQTAIVSQRTSVPDNAFG